MNHSSTGTEFCPALITNRLLLQSRCSIRSATSGHADVTGSGHQPPTFVRHLPSGPHQFVFQATQHRHEHRFGVPPVCIAHGSRWERLRQGRHTLHKNHSRHYGFGKFLVIIIPGTVCLISPTIMAVFNHDDGSMGSILKRFALVHSVNSVCGLCRFLSDFGSIEYHYDHIICNWMLINVVIVINGIDALLSLLLRV